jgi:hypothetical protein
MSVTDTGQNVTLEVTEIGHHRHTSLKCLQILSGGILDEIRKPFPSNGIHHITNILFIVAFEVAEIDDLPELRRLKDPPPTEDLTPLREFLFDGVSDDGVSRLHSSSRRVRHSVRVRRNELRRRGHYVGNPSVRC